MSRRRLYTFLGGYLVSETGTSMSAVALPWLVLSSTGSAAQTGVVGFAQMAPFVLVQATAGPFADRVGYRRAGVIGNLASALALGAVPLLHVLGGVAFGWLVVLVAVTGAARGVAEAAGNPITPALGRAAGMPLERAAGLFSAANRTGLLIGMPLGGVLIAVVGAANVLAFDAISFALVAISLFVAVPGGLGVSEVDGPLSLSAYRGQLVEGVGFLRRDRLILGLVTVIAVTNLLDQAFSSVLLPVWARDRAHTASALGLIGGAMGVGLLAGVLLGAWLVPKLPRRMTYAVAFLLAGVPPFVALAFADSLPPVLPVVVAAGIAGGCLNPINGAVLYERIPPRLQARVLGAVKASAWVGIPFGSLAGGGLASAAGLTAALLICAAAMLLATLCPFVFPSWKGLDRPADPVAVPEPVAV